MEISEVRIRESYNPGAISRVSATINGQEVGLWEGITTGGPAPRDFVVPAPPGFMSQFITIYLDTARVPSWNEIDAVELVGRDGSRQWASSAAASSTYADRVSSFLAVDTDLLQFDHSLIETTVK